MNENKGEEVLEGTTRKVFRFVYHQRCPVRVRDIQRGLGFSTPSLAYYHVDKLVKADLLKEGDEGYSVNKTVFENMVRIRQTVLPLQVTYAVFFLSALAVLATILRPQEVSATYVFALVIAAAASGIALYEAHKVAKMPF